MDLPGRVHAAVELAKTCGFTLSSEPEVGRLLMTLAAAVRPGGRILEIGTGTGVGTAWLIEGLRDRTDVELVTVEFDPVRARQAASAGWPAFVRPIEGDALTALPELGQFSLIFADAASGKLQGLELTIAALEDHGLLILDDMSFAGRAAGIEEGIVRVRRQLLTDDRFVCCELDWSSGLLLAARIG